MDLLALGKELGQSALERAASYRLGQAALRHADRALWVLEKSARWAVPPPLDADETPQPELVRPVAWLAFLPLLLAMRLTREGLSLLNLLLGKPPLRSADVVTYIQGKRRYLRTLKYAGNRMQRARSAGGRGAGGAWRQRLRHLVDLTMCFRGNMCNVANSDQVMIVHRQQEDSNMERLIERMMADAGARTDDEDTDSYTLTNATSVKSDSEPESEQGGTPEPPARASTPEPAARGPLPNNNRAIQDHNNPRTNGDANATFEVRPSEEKSAIPQPVDRKTKEPAKNSSENKEPPKTSGESKETIRTSSENRELPKTSGESKETIRTSSENKETAKTSSENRELPKTSGESKEPPKASSESSQKKRSPKMANGRVPDNSPNKKKENVRI